MLVKSREWASWWRWFGRVGASIASVGRGLRDDPAPGWRRDGGESATRSASRPYMQLAGKCIAWRGCWRVKERPGEKAKRSRGYTEGEGKCTHKVDI